MTILAGAAPADLGNRLCRSTVQVDPKANGATASRKGCRGPAELCPVVSRRGVVQCLSCMRRNGARAVLRGGGAGNSSPLPDYRKAKAAGMDWTEVLAVEDENPRARLAAELLKSAAFDSTTARVKAFVEQGGGCRATFFNYRRRFAGVSRTGNEE